MMGCQPLKGQQPLVTGANSGIGEGVAQALAAAVADAVVNFTHGQTPLRRQGDDPLPGVRPWWLRASR
jgi:NAD(P)-dependent dehydrogenase (short-subunit alcohol dehydrogenase family)